MAGELEMYAVSPKYQVAKDWMYGKMYVSVSRLSSELLITPKTAKKYLEIMLGHGLVEVERYEYRKNTISRRYSWLGTPEQRRRIALS